MNKYGKYLVWALGLSFLLLGINAFLQSRPEAKNERVYREIKKYSPYYLDKRVTGLDIKSREDRSFKESPSSMELFHELDRLEKTWGKKHLKLQKNMLTVLDKNGTIRAGIELKNRDEIDFVHRFYGI